MTILKVANRAHDFDEFNGFVEFTTVNTFDNAYVKNSVASPINEIDTVTHASLIVSGVTTDYWLHFRGYPVDVGSDGSSGQSWLQFFNSSGVLVADLIKDGNVSNNSKIRVYGTSTVTSTLTVNFVVNTAIFLDFHITVSGLTTTVNVYVNGAFAFATTNTNNGSRGIPVKAQMRSANVGYSTMNKMFFSEFIVANSSTVGMRLDEQEPSTLGTYQDMTGVVGNLNNADPKLGILATGVGQRTSWNPETYTGSGNIAAVVSSIRAHRKSGSPSKLAHFLRISGVNYDGSDVSIADYTQTQNIWSVNPATGLPWVTADMSGIEFGFKSAA